MTAWSHGKKAICQAAAPPAVSGARPWLLERRPAPGEVEPGVSYRMGVVENSSAAGPPGLH